MPTSCSDRDGYREFCRQAAEDEYHFKRFRHHPECMGVIDTLSAADGAAYMNHALRNDPQIVRHLDLLRRNDEVGAPLVCAYKGGIGPFCPTTLRYVMVATELARRFGPLDGMHVVEIGGGYGGQCRILNALFRIESYVIVDLPEPLALARRYLERFGIANVVFAGPDRLPDRGYDLLISNYAYSELNREVQDAYFDAVVSRARHGYMICNETSFADSRPGFLPSVEYTMSRIPTAAVVRGEPALAPPDASRNHALLHW